MAGTFTQIYIHYVFAVRGRENLLASHWRNDLFKYISGIIKNKEQKPIIVNGVSDHVHILVGLNTSMNISELIRDVKNNSSKFINENKLVLGKFSWQEVYGAFSVSHSQLNSVYKYIDNQELKHKTLSFKDEYVELLNNFGIEYLEKHLFNWVE